MSGQLSPLASRAPRPSHITLPDLAVPYPTMLEFLDARFPRVGREVWRARLEGGSIHDEQGRVVDEDTPYRVNARLSYYREVENEPRIPVEETVVFENDDILVADKPHFLPVTPSGRYVNECLLHRLMARTGNHELVAVHRLDRETAGLVLFSKRKASRKTYFSLFREGVVDKHYEAVACLEKMPEQRCWRVESRIERSDVRMQFMNVPGTNAPGEINARSHIELLRAADGLGFFSLRPLTGKTHQLRLHMGLIGFIILNDRLYPEVQAGLETPDYAHPLQLLARSLAFTDPLTGLSCRFASGRRLYAWAGNDAL